MKPMLENNPVLQAIRARRSIRRYRAEPVPPALVEGVLEAAIWAPSAHNRQPWRFAVLQDPAPKERLARAMGARLRADRLADGDPVDAVERDAGRSYLRITGAPVVIVACLSMADMDTYPDARRANAERMMAAQSTALAVGNLLLAAHSLGLGACWLCAPLFCPDTVREALDLPADWEAQGLVTMGWPAEAKTKDRVPLERRVVYVDRSKE